MGGVAHQLHFIQRPHLHLAFDVLTRRKAGDVHLDPIDADFDLTSHLTHDVVAAVHHHPIAASPFVGDQSAGRATDRSQQGIAAGRHARPAHDAGLDGIAQIDTDLPQRIGIEKAGHSGRQQFADIGGRDDRRQSFAAMEK